MRAQPVRDSSVVVLPDSSNFVIASLVVVQPASSPMSSLGHVALRMQCPAYGLDFLWSQNTMDSPTLWIQQLYGNNPVAGVWQPTDSMLNVYRNEQRGTRQYTLNLTHHEKQRLWMLLDEVSEMGVNGRLRVDNHHCASAVIQQLKAATIQRQLDTGDEQRQIGQYGQWAARHSPWIQFALVLMAGNQHDRMLSRDCMVCPEDIADYLKKAKLTDTYRWMNSEGEYTKYVRIDGRNIVLSADDDAATQQWGTPWRMPTMYDIEDLLSLCTCTYQWDNSYGYIYTVTGPNGNSITLSCTGTAEGTQQPAWGLVLSFLTATLANDTRNAYILGNDVISNNLKVTFARRYLGFNIRPVISKTATAVNNVNGIADGNRNGGWYTLNGQRFNTAPTQQGLYIHNGKKAVVK